MKIRPNALYGIKQNNVWWDITLKKAILQVIFVLPRSSEAFDRNSTSDFVFGNHKPRTRGTVLSKSHSIFYLHGTGRVCKVLRFTVNVNT